MLGSRYLCIMQHIERQKLILIITTAVLLGLAALVIVISIIFSSSETTATPEPTYTPPAPTSTEPGSGAGEDETAVITSEEGEEDLAPPEGMYSNDYSEDEGYVPLPDGFDPEISPIEGTVYDDTYVYFTSSRLMCELSNKQTATPKSVEQIKAFAEDLSFNSSSLATTTKTQLLKWVSWYDNHEGERVPASQQEEIAVLFCQQGETDFTEDDHAR